MNNKVIPYRRPDPATQPAALYPDYLTGRVLDGPQE
jgi:hypothetical protein